MKLLGFHNNKQIVASVARYDFISAGEDDDYILADGGQPNIGDFAGYNKYWGISAWFEVPQTMAELYNDWNRNNPRKYGVWNIEDVKILSPEEYPNTNSFEWQANNEIWGTNGPNGDEPTTYVMLKDCSKDHLKKISKLCEKRGNKKLKNIAEYWIDNKKTDHLS